MAARLNEDTTKIHFHIYSEDLEYIDARFCRAGMRTVGRSRALRSIIHQFVQHMRRQENAQPVKFDPSITELLDS